MRVDAFVQWLNATRDSCIAYWSAKFMFWLLQFPSRFLLMSTLQGRGWWWKCLSYYLACGGSAWTPGSRLGPGSASAAIGIQGCNSWYKIKQFLSLPPFQIIFIILSATLKIFIYLYSYKEAETEERDRSPICWFIPNCQELDPCLPHGCGGPRVQTVLCCSPKCVGWELCWKWSSWDDSTQFPYGQSHLLCYGTDPSINNFDMYLRIIVCLKNYAGASSFTDSSKFFHTF